MPRIPSADERTVQAIVAEALREESREPVLSGELPEAGLVEKLGRITLDATEGEPVRLGWLWEASPAALIFLRHYG